jgi:hypothetical protein
MEVSADECHNVVLLRKDMGLSHREFFASLATLAREVPCRVSDSGAIVEYDSGEIHIALGPESQRQLGLMKLPRTWVSLEFRNLSKAQRALFLERFDLAFHRGGG